jgi:hypothetical protein
MFSKFLGLKFAEHFLPVIKWKSVGLASKGETGDQVLYSMWWTQIDATG